jgi:hypothetical protein
VYGTVNGIRYREAGATLHPDSDLAAFIFDKVVVFKHRSNVEVVEPVLYCRFN